MFPVPGTRLLAHWTISQRMIHVILPTKMSILKRDKSNPVGTVGDLIVVAKKEAGLTQENLGK
ncbi:MAG TPA: hypothetical protein VHG71_01180 [Verrucomicrobiae bacterium]|nr:hypothetical protein [Verrucomicrobiae bacterium]